MIEVTGDRNLKPGELERKPWLKSYPPDVPFHLHYPEIPLYAFLDEAAKDWPDKTALVFAPTGAEMTYAELLEKTNRFAHALQNLGVEKGDRVAIMLPNCFQFVIAFYGILKAGAVVTPLNPRYTPRELQELLSDSGAETMICLDQMYPLIKSIQPATSIQRIITVQLSPEPIKTGKDALHFSVLISQNAPNYEPIEIDPKEDLATLMYTSGTTGRPKGAMLTHSNISCAEIQLNGWFKPFLRPQGEVISAIVPFFHIYGINVCIHFCVHNGFSLVVFPKFDPKITIEAIKKWHISLLWGVPAIYAALYRVYQGEPNQCDFSSIRFCGSGTTSFPEELYHTTEKITGSLIIEGYGLTETSPLTHINPPTDARQIGSIGIPLPDTKVKIDFQSGELLVKGPQVFKGYWCDSQSTENAFTGDGFFRTGDVAEMTNNGFFQIKDRLKDMINVRGEKICSREVEIIIESHPAIEEVAVVGKKDDFWGEKVVAYVKLKEGTNASFDELISYCETKLADFKLPKEIVFVDQFPRTAIGKIAKFLLRNT